MNPLRPRAAPGRVERLFNAGDCLPSSHAPSAARELRYTCEHNPGLPALLHRIGSIDGESMWEMILGF